METAVTEQTKFFVIDFDSTLAKVESLDLLCEISLEGRPDKEECMLKVQEITNLGMEGKIDFAESLAKRLEILQANKRHMPELIERLKHNISDSFNRNKIFFESHRDEIYILSSGFKEIITCFR